MTTRRFDRLRTAMAPDAGTPVQDDRRVFLLAVAAIAAHLAQSWVTDPDERTFRATYLGVCAVTAASTLLPRRARGIVAIAAGVGPLGGAVAGHVVPIVRGGVPPATETAILNLGGGGVLVALGIGLARSTDG